MNLASVIYGLPALQQITVTRTTGSFQSGGWVANVPTTITMWAIVSTVNPRDLIHTPEADRVTEVLVFFVEQEIFVTQENPTENVSDEIEFRGDDYHVISVDRKAHYGFFEVRAVRKAGN